jgi:hypothetical protein
MAVATMSSPKTSPQRTATGTRSPTKANLLTGYNCFAELAEVCAAFCEIVSGRSTADRTHPGGGPDGGADPAPSAAGDFVHRGTG